MACNEVSWLLETLTFLSIYENNPGTHSLSFILALDKPWDIHTIGFGPNGAPTAHILTNSSAIILSIHLSLVTAVVATYVYSKSCCWRLPWMRSEFSSSQAKTSFTDPGTSGLDSPVLKTSLEHPPKAWPNSIYIQEATRRNSGMSKVNLLLRSSKVLPTSSSQDELSINTICKTW